MIDPLTLALIYAISKVCEGVSLNVISSTVFESFKDKIFKQKGKSEKELLSPPPTHLRLNSGASVGLEVGRYGEREKRWGGYRKAT